MTITKSFTINFSKYQANGNDFLLIEENKHNELFNLIKPNAHILCDRNFGIGADGILLVYQAKENIFVRVLNKDNSEAKNCGNGLRCVAKYYFEKNKNLKKLNLNLFEKNYVATFDNDLILIHMGECVVRKSEIDFFDLENCLGVFFANITNFHLVWFFSKKVEPEKIIEEIKKKVVNFFDYNHSICWFDEKNTVFSSVFERGVGFTQACGSGGIASACSFILLNQIKCRELKVVQPGGQMNVLIGCVSTQLNETIFDISQKGSAKKVFLGSFSDEIFVKYE